MSEGTELPLRKALDAIDGMRVRILLGGWLAVIVTLAVIALLAVVSVLG
jgi:hypothetical protein